MQIVHSWGGKTWTQAYFAISDADPALIQAQENLALAELRALGFHVKLIDVSGWNPDGDDSYDGAAQ